jgi:CBS domain-containing protein
MEQTESNESEGLNLKARIVKQMIKPTTGISNKISVKTALKEMQAAAVDPAPITDERGEFLGSLSKNKMNRDVGGFGHDPETEAVAGHIQTDSVYCFEDEPIEQAEQIMLQAKVDEVSVVTREKLLVGSIDLKAISRQKHDRAAARNATNPAPETALPDVQ